MSDSTIKGYYKIDTARLERSTRNAIEDIIEAAGLDADTERRVLEQLLESATARQTTIEFTGAGRATQ